MALDDDIDHDWETPRPRRASPLADAGMGALRVALLFGSAAVAVALILTPIIEIQTEKMLYSSYAPGVDMMSTGSIGGGLAGGSVGQRSATSYVVRRSVLQPSPSSVCVIRSNGMRTGDC